jgi:hypothetical protein
MAVIDKIRKYENLHIVFWLIKDSCWMMEFKWLGTFIMFPTLFLAVYLLLKTLKTNDFYINAAILCWITANSFWMLMEFFNNNQNKLLAAIPFGLGLLFVAIFYWKNYKISRATTESKF